MKSGFFTRKSAHEARAAKRQGVARAEVSKVDLRKLGVAGVRDMNPKARHPEMLPTGPENAMVYVLGDAPSMEEDGYGKPLSDAAGKFLKEAIPHWGLSETIFDNVCRTRPPKDRPVKPSELECFRGVVEQSIIENRPKVIIGLGNLPLKWMFPDVKNVKAVRGRKFPVKIQDHTCWFIPTLHPSHLQRIAEIRDDKVPGSEWIKFWEDDLKRAYTLAEEGDVPEVTDPKTAMEGTKHCLKIEDVEEAVRELRKCKAIGADGEMHRLRPYYHDSMFLSLSLSDGDRTWAIPIDHHGGPWSSKGAWALQRPVLFDLLRDLFYKGPRIVCHNAPHEYEWMLKMLGLCVHEFKWGCSHQAAFVLNPGPPGQGAAGHRLEDLCLEKFGLDVKGLTPGAKWVHRLRELPLHKVLDYNALDAKWCLRLWYKLMEEVRDEGMMQSYKLQIARMPAIINAQAMGVPIDQTARKELEVDLQKQTKALELEIKKDPNVRKFENATRKPFDARSPAVVGRLLGKQMGIAGVKVGANKYTTSKKILEAFRGDYPIIDKLLTLRSLDKLTGTYVSRFDPLHKESYVFPDGRIHCRFSIARTRTARLACVAEWTPIRTSVGVKPIIYVAVGDLVWTHRGRWKKVVRTIFKGFQQMYDVHLGNGQVLTCTNDHRVLTSVGTWLSLRSIQDGSQQELRVEPEERQAGPLPVLGQGVANDRGGRTKAGNHPPQRFSHTQEEHGARGLQGTQGVSLLQVEGRGSEPNDGKAPGEVPALERGLRRRVWLQDDPGRPEPQAVQAQVSVCEGSRNETNPTIIPCSPHRRECLEQRSGQLGDLHPQGTPSYPLLAAGHGYVQIEAIVPRESLGVYDLTVEDDHSYEACGVQNHNSEDPNNQNWPKRKNKHVRKQLAAPPGWIWVAVDQGQIEARGLAMESCDSAWVRMIEEKYDVHTEWAAKIAAIDDNFAALLKKDPKAARHRAKNEWVFPAFYGSSLKSIIGNLKLEDEEAADRLFKSFWKVFRGVKAWQRRQWQKYERDGFVTSLTGRRRWGPLSYNMAINTPIQTLASDICVDAMIRLFWRSIDEGKPWLAPALQIHDDLTFLVPEEHLEYAITAIVEEQLGYKADWLNVPLAVEVEVGYNLAEMDFVGSWASDDLVRA